MGMGPVQGMGRAEWETIDPSSCPCHIPVWTFPQLTILSIWSLSQPWSHSCIVLSSFMFLSSNLQQKGGEGALFTLEIVKDQLATCNESLTSRPSYLLEG